MEVSAANVGAIRVLQVRGRLDHSQAKDFEAALAMFRDELGKAGQ